MNRLGIDYEQSVFFLGPSVEQNVRDTQMTTRLTKDARLEIGEAAALVSRLSRLRRSTLALALTPLSKSEEKERMLPV